MSFFSDIWELGNKLKFALYHLACANVFQVLKKINDVVKS